MSLVVDASVAVKWVLPEPDSHRATGVKAAPGSLVAPTLALAEIGSAIWKRARRGEVSSADAVAAIRVAKTLLTQLVPIEELGEQAIELAIHLDHPIYDCFYLALAAREAIPLITADATQFEMARRARIEARML